jgi:hypothetical protein
MQSSTSLRPPGKRVAEGFHSPTVSHQLSPASAYQPASMQKYSAPAFAAAAISGRSRAVLGSPYSVFM